MKNLVKKAIRRIAGMRPAATSPQQRVARGAATAIADRETQDYWTGFNVTLHRRFKDAQESLDFFHWRNDQYFGYIERMPVAGFDGKAVLDYGCGPGHDVIGFANYSEPSRLVAADISPSSLKEAEERLALHGKAAEFVQLDPAAQGLPFASDSFDHIHSSGVLHHMPNLDLVMTELRRVLKPGGTFNIMVYNYDSLWMHLFVAHHKQIIEKAYQGLSLRDAFTSTTDTETCPIADCYTPEEFLGIAQRNGFEGVFTGAGISMHELLIAPTRFSAIQDQLLPRECREFLLALKVDEHGYPIYNGHLAGIDACFQLRKPHE